MALARINGHEMYHEIHGRGEPAICMGGWGTFRHGGERNLARGLTERYQTLATNHRGIGDPTDDATVAPTMDLHARDVIGLPGPRGPWSELNGRYEAHARRCPSSRVLPVPKASSCPASATWWQTMNRRPLFHNC